MLGGAPFHQPVRRSGDAYVLGSRQPTYAADLLIGPAQEPRRGVVAGPLTSAAVECSGWATPFPEPPHLGPHAAPRVAQGHADDDGSAGPRDAVVRPLVHVVDASGLPRACPLLEVDRLLGDEAGARWVLAPSDARLTAAVVRAAVPSRALEGSSSSSLVRCAPRSSPAKLRSCG